MNIKFIENTHQYFAEESGRSKELISVSKFAKQFEAYKDWYAIAEKYAKKNGETAEYWQKTWKDKALKSSTVGTIFHNIREQELVADENTEYEGVRCAREMCTFSDGVKWGIPITNLKANTFYPELIIYDLDFGICGQSDKVIVTDTHIHIGDYKTDKVLDFKGYSNQWKKAEKLLAPLDHLDNCNGVMYSLKMSLYMYMLWKQNKHLLPGKLFIEHITLKRDEEGIPVLDENNRPIVLKEEIVEVPYLKKEVILMLKHYQHKNKK